MNKNETIIALVMAGMVAVLVGLALGYKLNASRVQSEQEHIRELNQQITSLHRLLINAKAYPEASHE